MSVLKDGENTLEDYVRYVRNDLMGVTREDLVANIARHVDSSVFIFLKNGASLSGKTTTANMSMKVAGS